MQIIAGTLGVLTLGAACGLVNGAAVVFARVQPIVATLASGAVFGGLALLLRPLPGGAIDDNLSDALTYDIAGVPTSLAFLTGRRVAAAKLVAYALGGVFASLAGLYVAMVTQTGDAGIVPAFFSRLPPLAQPFFEGLVLAIAIFIGAAGMLRLRSRLEAFER